MNDKIQRFNCLSKNGNTISFFFNPENNLIVLDLVKADESGGNETVRLKLGEKGLLNF